MADQTTAPQDSTIQFEDFAKIELRVGLVIEAENHPNADKLIVLKVDLGDETRQLCAGLRGHYEARELLGKRLIIVANLAPRKMRGLESQGMLLAASTPNQEKVIILTTDDEVPPGSTVS